MRYLFKSFTPSSAGVMGTSYDVETCPSQGLRQVLHPHGVRELAPRVGIPILLLASYVMMSLFTTST